MKNLLLSVVLLSGFSLFARHRLTGNHNMMRPGDEIVKQQVEYKDPGRSGENVLWDFGKLTSINDEYSLIYSVGEDSVIIGTEHRTMYYYSLSGDSLLCKGFENPTTLMINEHPELLLKFPVSYNDSTYCRYNGNGKYSDFLKISAMGSMSSKADAYGMIILPDKDTLKNVIRVHTIKKIAEGSEPLFFSQADTLPPPIVTSDSIDYRLANDTVLLAVETYRWYAKGYRYPIFETVKSITEKQGQERDFFEVAFFYPPQEHYYLADDAENLSELFGDGEEDPTPGLKPNPGDTFSYNFYPNPVDRVLHIEYYIDRSSNVEIGIFDMHGIRLFDNRLLSQLPGVHTSSVDMSDYARGNYVLKITTGASSKESIILKK